MASEKYPDGNHYIDPDDLNDDFKATLRRLVIPDGQKSGCFTLHSLRHFFKSHAIAQGVPREYVDAWQGHSQKYKIASDAYVHIQDKDSQRWIGNIDFSDISSHSPAPFPPAIANDSVLSIAGRTTESLCPA
ncbi:hypothetical protein [Bremerella alba]|uniref:Tyr recombinase domain-containing protein n=1 Tax=Bremerella alba TaxID=980252 RepID=A0A7V8VAG5_9BACT|nr:hypothetical protein [Bremerella alba]MBA2117840.1 hypothetical protein [Bremerella alba]